MQLVRGLLGIQKRRAFSQAPARLTKIVEHAGVAKKKKKNKKKLVWTLPWRTRPKSESMNDEDTREDEQRHADEKRVIREAVCKSPVAESHQRRV